MSVDESQPEVRVAAGALRGSRFGTSRLLWQDHTFPALLIEQPGTP